MLNSARAEQSVSAGSLNDGFDQAHSRIIAVYGRLRVIRDRLVGPEPEPAQEANAPEPQMHLARSLSKIHNGLSEIEDLVARIEKRL